MKTCKRDIILTIASFAVVYTHAQTNIIIQPPVIAQDFTAKIRWSAETGGVYQVLAAESLIGEGAQGLQWIIREANCPSKGTNAEWMDVGTPLWIPRILPPRFEPMRFYRVQKVGQATLTPPPTVSVLLSQPTNGIIGDLFVAMNVTLIDTNQQISEVALFVDGQKLSTSGEYGSTNYVNSCEWPNGPHEIYAIATMVDSGETLPDNDSDEGTVTNAANLAIGVSPSRFVTFSNYISQYFVSIPFFNPDVGQTQEVIATFPEETCWRLTVLNYLDQPVRVFTNVSSSLYIAWDGNDEFGNPMPFGFYDYYIEARPAQFGCLGEGGGTMMMTAMPSGGVVSDTPSEATTKAGIFSRAAMQFSRRNTGVAEDIRIPSLKPNPPPEFSTIELPELEITFEVDANGMTSEFINGVPAILYPPGFGHSPIESEMMELSVQDLLGGSGFETASFGDAVYTTRTPVRVPGSIFMGHAGTIGLAYQGHHPSRPPEFARPLGGVISVGKPPYGKIRSASIISDRFENVMGASGWRTSFKLGDDNFKSTDIFPILGPGTGTSTFAQKCNFGMFVGHMTATATTDPDYGCTHSWLPIYNSDRAVAAYEWIGMPGFDLGPPNGASPLQWMALYGCNSLQNQDWNDMWTKFLLPMPPNIRLILGAEEGVFLHPIFGWQFAADMNGLTTVGNVPKTIAESWYNAARTADRETSKSLRYRFTMGTRHMTIIYRDTTQGGSWRTLNDTIWNWGNDLSYDWFDVSLDERQVWP